MQAMADTAALDMARYVNIADTSITLGGVTNGLAPSTQYLNGKLANADTDNGSNATLSETPGVWLNGVFTPENGTVKVGTITETVYCWNYHPVLPQPCNAVKVTATQTVPQIFAGGQPTVSRSAIATVAPEAGFGIGSYLASVDSQQSAVLNTCWGRPRKRSKRDPRRLGGLGQHLRDDQSAHHRVRQTADDIQRHDDILDRARVAVHLERRSGQPGGPAQLQRDADAVALLRQYGTHAPTPWSSPRPRQVQLCQLVSINGSTCTSPALSNAALSTSLNVLQTLTTEAEVANGTNAVDLGSSLQITGVSDATLALTLGQIPQVAYGPLGTTASTAQLTADLQLNDGLAGWINIPLSAAQGTATLTTLTCAFNAMTATDIQPTTTAVTGSINVAGVGVGSISVSGLNSTTTSPLGYGPSVVPPTATTAANDTNPQEVGTTTPTLAAGSLVVGTLSGSVLNGAVGPVLQAAGVSVGGAEVADLSTDCGSVSLVQ